MELIEFLKVAFLGLVEGVTEWLPVSSTGHMKLVDEFLQLNASEGFKEMFFVMIQLGAILAVIFLFWKKMWPFKMEKGKPVCIKETFSIWFKVMVATIPGAVITLLFDDYIEAHFSTFEIISAMLVLYGIAFIVVENWNKKRTPKIGELADIDYRTALLIGLFQVLSIIPGTSRSGATIVGALLLGVSRTAAAEFTFFLAVPAMLGWSLLKLVKFGFNFTTPELLMLIIGMAVAFIVSMLVIRFLMGYIKKHDFKVFGWYRIVLGVILLGYYLLFK